MVRFFRLFGFLSAICVFALAASAQYTGASANPQPNATPPHCAVSGVVVNSITGESLPRAQVTMYGPETRSTLTDGDGHFSFEDVAQAMVGFQARKPGFTVASHRVDFRVQTCTTDTSSGVKVALVPTAAIVGRITDPNGDPIDDVPVRVGKYVFSEGRKQFNMAGSGTTNYDGRFRVANLDAGSYILIVGPSSPSFMARARDITPVSYYPGVADRASAAPIDAKPGSKVEINMTVNEVPAFKVSGRVAGVSSEARGVSIEMKNEAGDDVGMTVGSRREANEFSIIGVPAGSYRVRVTAFERDGITMTGSTRVSVSHDISNLQVPVAAPMTLNVNVRAEGVEPSSSSNGNPLAMVRLISTSEEGQAAFMTPLGNKLQRWGIKNVERGTYIAEISSNGPGYVASARLGGTDLLREPVTIESDQDPVEIIVRNDSGQLSGTVVGGSQLLIVAIPSDNVLYPPRAGAFSQTGAAKFQMNLAPGDYTVFAMDPEGVEYTNPRVMEKYASYGVHVSISPQEKKEITMTKIEVAQ
jgi:hypothetical protein